MQVARGGAAPGGGGGVGVGENFASRVRVSSCGGVYSHVSVAQQHSLCAGSNRGLLRHLSTYFASPSSGRAAVGG
jgi:hypothetical protein